MGHPDRALAHQLRQQGGGDTPVVPLVLHRDGDVGGVGVLVVAHDPAHPDRVETTLLAVLSEQHQCDVIDPVDVVDQPIQHRRGQSIHRGQEAPPPRLRGQVGVGRSEKLAICWQQRPEDRCGPVTQHNRLDDVHLPHQDRSP